MGLAEPCSLFAASAPAEHCTGHQYRDNKENSMFLAELGMKLALTQQQACNLSLCRHDTTFVQTAAAAVMLEHWRNRHSRATPCVFANSKCLLNLIAGKDDNCKPAT